jgi:hypothetical protein
MAISDDDLKRFRSILMYDDETMLQAVAAYRDDKQAADWWLLVVDLGGGKFAAASFADVTAQIKTGQKNFLESPLGRLVGGVLKPVDVVAEQSSSDLAAVREKASVTPSQVLVVVDKGEYKGVVSAATTRGGAGLFGSELVKLAGEYASIPAQGTLSRRRMEAMAARKKKSE